MKGANCQYSREASPKADMQPQCIQRCTSALALALPASHMRCQPQPAHIGKHAPKRPQEADAVSSKTNLLVIFEVTCVAQFCQFANYGDIASLVRIFYSSIVSEQFAASLCPQNSVGRPSPALPPPGLRVSNGAPAGRLRRSASRAVRYKRPVARW